MWTIVAGARGPRAPSMRPLRALIKLKPRGPTEKPGAGGRQWPVGSVVWTAAWEPEPLTESPTLIPEMKAGRRGPFPARGGLRWPHHRPGLHRTSTDHSVADHPV